VIEDNFDDLNSRIYKSAAYRKWEKSFLNLNKGKDILGHLVKLEPSRKSRRFTWLKKQVLVTCFQFEQYDIYKDPGQKLYNEEVERINEIDSILKSIGRIIRFNVENQGKLGSVLWGAFGKWGVIEEGENSSGYPQGTQPPTVKVLNELLATYSDRLSKFKLGEKILRSDKLMKVENKRLKGHYDVYGDDFQLYPRKMIARGGLAYPKPGNQFKRFRVRDIEKKSLFFHLAFIFRHFTDGKLKLGSSLQTQPEFGCPQYDLIANIYDQLVPPDDGNGVSQEAVGKLVKRLTADRITMHPWLLPNKSL
jgi:hypothetical protein